MSKLWVISAGDWFIWFNGSKRSKLQPQNPKKSSDRPPLSVIIISLWTKFSPNDRIQWILETCVSNQYFWFHSNIIFHYSCRATSIFLNPFVHWPCCGRVVNRNIHQVWSLNLGNRTGVSHNKIERNHSVVWVEYRDYYFHASTRGPFYKRLAESLRSWILKRLMVVDQ